MNETQIGEFDYSILDKDTADFLKEKERNMSEIVGNAYTLLGKELKEAQVKLAGKNQYDGIFERWFTSKGYKKQTVYNLINRYELVQSLDEQTRVKIEELPLTLTYEMSKPSAKEEVNQAVFDGDIRTHKEYKEMERKLKQAQQAKQQAEAQAEQAKKSEEIALKKLEEAESKEPEIIERTKEVVPDHIKDELEATKRQLEFVNRQLNELKKEQIDTDDFNEDEAERERKKLEWEAEKNVLEFKIKVDRFLKEVAITAFMKGAIATSSKSTKDKLYQSVEELKEITSQMKIAIRGRIQV